MVRGSERVREIEFRNGKKGNVARWLEGERGGGERGR